MKYLQNTDDLMICRETIDTMESSPECDFFNPTIQRWVPAEVSPLERGADTGAEAIF